MAEGLVHHGYAAAAAAGGVVKELLHIGRAGGCVDAVAVGGVISQANVAVAAGLQVLLLLLHAAVGRSFAFVVQGELQ